VNNDNLISSNQYGIYLGGEIKLRQTLLINSIHGVIEGVEGIYADGDDFNLINKGTIIGGVYCGANANDVILDYGKIEGGIHLGGNSVLALSDRTGTTSEAIYIDSGGDTLTGGLSANRFIFWSDSQVTEITNFTPARDEMILHFAGQLTGAYLCIGTQAATKDQRIIYNPDDGFVFYDPDGNGPEPQVHFATISPHLALLATDFLA
jgi:hypothetical protein